MRIRNIIFDLGGVIIDINYKKTSEAFKALGAFNFDLVYSQSKQDSLFDDYDVGKISSAEFRTGLCKRLDLISTDKNFDNAWNAMLGDLPLERLSLIKEMRKKYKTYLFSNTNEIHLREVFNISKKQNGFDTFKDFFNKEYYSHIFRRRKPNPDSFLALLKENDLKPDETLFVDDSIQHVVGAKMAGIHAVHLTNGKSIFDINELIADIEKNFVSEKKNEDVVLVANKIA